MERKNSNECSVVFLVKGGKFKLRNLPSRKGLHFCSSRRRVCPVLKHNRVSDLFKGFKIHNFEHYGQIVKSFAVPKFMPKAALIYVSKDPIQAVNKELYSFIWNGKDKVKRSALINGIEHDGLKLLHIECVIKDQRIMCLRKLSEDYVSLWKILLDHCWECGCQVYSEMPV